MREESAIDLIRQVFVQQCEEGLASMEEALLSLEDHPNDVESLNDVFRVCHTLKGDAGTLGFGSLAEFAHALEDLLDVLRNRTIALNHDLVSLLLDCVDATREMVTNELADEPREHPKRAGLLERLAAAVECADSQLVSIEGSRDDQTAGVSGGGLRKDGRGTSLRIEVKTLDRLLNLAGELAIARTGFAQSLAELEGIGRGELLELHQLSDPLMHELQELITDLRLVPVGPLFRQQRRLVRTTAMAEAKQVRLEISGDESELDTTIIEQLRDPLAHMIRNAVIHGLESPEEREASGKARVGCIALRAHRDGASIVVEVVDDGRGLARDRIRQRARQLGYGEISDDQLCDLIFEPGLSTTEKTTLSAGRGVGMDVVRSNIQALGGTVGVESEQGRGTCIRIRLPLTVAIIEGFSVGVGDQLYVLPLSAVTECLELKVDTNARQSRTGLIDLRGEALPYFRLRDVFGHAGDAPARQHVVVVHHEGALVGIAVDALYGQSQAVIKPLGNLFNDLPSVSGVTIRGDGQLALILDVPALLREEVGWQRKGSSGGRHPHRPLPSISAQVAR